MATSRITLEYDGMGFAGWAAQPGQRTVEGVLSEALRAITGSEDIVIRVAGRTDAGVSATGQVVSVQTADLPRPERLRDALNGTLPPDVSVRDVAVAPEGFDARADALLRAYEYRVLEGPRSALRRRRVLNVRGPLDHSALRESAAATTGTHDFTAFTPTQTQHVFFQRTVTRCEWTEREDELVLCIEADAFLRHMVRVIVGSMLQVARGVWPADRYVALLHGAPRSQAGPTAAAHPLTLVRVDYPE